MSASHGRGLLEPTRPSRTPGPPGQPVCQQPTGEFLGKATAKGNGVLASSRARTSKIRVSAGPVGALMSAPISFRLRSRRELPWRPSWRNDRGGPRRSRNLHSNNLTERNNCLGVNAPPKSRKAEPCLEPSHGPRFAFVDRPRPRRHGPRPLLNAGRRGLRATLDHNRLSEIIIERRDDSLGEDIGSSRATEEEKNGRLDVRP